VRAKEIAMFRPTACSLLACLAVLLATAGCVAETVEAADRTSVAAPSPSLAGPRHELHRMFDAEKQKAEASELPAQF
jgi:hypothetical protein